jgi:predicted dehydrogenase/threonine dehydrogenase-like Zn-dependent dehydrogenase
LQAAGAGPAAGSTVQQVIQNVRSGQLSVVELPDPVARPGQVLIANAASLISAGTEKTTIELAQKSLLGKARERPDHVRRALEKMRNEGFFRTLQQLREKLDEPLALGYSSAGTVLACGAGVQELRAGDRVASNGPHAGVVSVPRNLCARVPDGVSLEHAAFATVGAIALQGVRLSRLGLGDTALVVGLGLVGQLTVALLRAAGCRVLGTDPDPAKCELALRAGAEDARAGLEPQQVRERTAGLGADAVLIAASTPSNQPVELAAEAVRAKGRIVAVGTVGMNLPRRPIYFKEAEFVVSCSYGPGRYDPSYEEHGRDYPPAYVRWTEQRNLQAVLDLIAAGRLDPAPLISHRFDIADAARAYELIQGGREPYLGVLLRYPEPDAGRLRRRVVLGAARAAGRVGVGCLGAGNFARMVLLPLVRREPRLRPVALCSAGATSAEHTGRKLGFEQIATGEREVLEHPDVSAVFVLTRHDQHARQVLEAIRAGKHVFVEKPLALDVEQVEQIEAALRERAEAAPLVMVGFNRRFSPAARLAREVFDGVRSPLTVSVRFNAGAIPPDHWTQDEQVGGGRIVGEACHGIDLATYLVGSPPVRVHAESVGGPDAPRITDDQCFISLRHANGSLSSVAYLAGGDRAYPKERVEVFGGGRVAVIEDFRRLETSASGRRATRRFRGQDKGHRAEIEAFARALAEGEEPPIPWEQLRAVSLASILAVRSLREGVPFEVR